MCRCLHRHHHRRRPVWFQASTRMGGTPNLTQRRTVYSWVSFLFAAADNVGPDIRPRRDGRRADAGAVVGCHRVADPGPHEAGTAARTWGARCVTARVRRGCCRRGRRRCCGRGRGHGRRCGCRCRCGCSRGGGRGRGRRADICQCKTRAVVEQLVALESGWRVRAVAVGGGPRAAVVREDVSRPAVFLARVDAQSPVIRTDAVGQVARIGWLRRVIRVQCPGSCSRGCWVLDDSGEGVALAASVSGLRPTLRAGCKLPSCSVPVVVAEP